MSNSDLSWNSSELINSLYQWLPRISLTNPSLRLKSQEWVAESTCQGCKCYFEVSPLAATNWLSLDRWCEVQRNHNCQCHTFPARIQWALGAVYWRLSLLTPFDVGQLLPGEPVASNPTGGTPDCLCGKPGDAFVICKPGIGHWICQECFGIQIPKRDYFNRALNLGEIAAEFQKIRKTITVNLSMCTH